jgi:transposase-like protein
MRKLLRKQGFAPTRVTTDKLRSYEAAAKWRSATNAA